MTTKKTDSAGLGSLEELLLGTQFSKEELDSVEKLNLNGDSSGDNPPIDPPASSLNNDNLDDPLGGAGLQNNGEKQNNNQQPVAGDSNQYREILKKTFGKKVDKVSVEGDDGNDVEVDIDELEITPELFTQIATQVVANIRKEAGENKVSIDGLSEMTLKIIDLEKKGASPEDLGVLHGLQEQVTNPLDRLDLTQREDQIAAVFMHQRAHGQPDEDTQILIQGYERQGVLEEKARKAESQLRAAVEQKTRQIEEIALQQKAERDEREKKLKKEFKENLNEFQLNDTSKSKLFDFAFKKDPARGGFTEMQVAFAQAMEDPKKAVKIAFLLRDEEEFANQIANKKVIDSKLETASKIKVTLKPSAQAGEQHRGNQNTGLGDLSELQ